MSKVADLIIEHLKSYGPRARVAVVVPLPKDIEFFMEGHENSLLRLHGHDFPGIHRAKSQINHVGYGQIQAISYKTAHKHQLIGPQWSMVVIMGEIPEEVVTDLRSGLRIGPNPQFLVASGKDLTLEDDKTDVK
jgi:hypothetical protein